MWSRALKAPRVLRRFKISLSSARRLCAGVRLGFKRKHGLSGNGIAIRIRPEPGRIRPNRSPESQLWKVVGEEAKTINNRWDVFIFVRLLSAPLPRDTFSSLRMTSINLNSLSETEKLKLTVLYDVKKICEEVGDSLTEKVTFDKPALELIAEMVWRKVQDYGVDLEHFSKHAKRATINADDVKLLVRKNECLKERISRLSEDLSSASTSKRKKKDKDADAGSEAGPSDAGPSDAADTNLIGNFDIGDDWFMDD